MNASSELFERVEARDLLRELTRRLVREAKARPSLRAPAIAPLMENAIAGLDAVVGALTDDPTSGTFTDAVHACPVCDNEPGVCEHGGNCALHSDPKCRPEPWDALTIMLPRTMMRTVEYAIAFAQELCERDGRSRSSALSLIALDFVGTHDWNFLQGKPREQDLRFLVETYEWAMGLRLVVSDQSGKLLYGLDNLASMGGVEVPEQRSAIK